ncbi:hypothetical protein [Microvirga antarctica]|uniref:hypothetical protein n=1 Tax=Microvirga antarctica TaxID=2819233 RepID=UPI001B307EF6|nr:hypothetical protein [Microvirga antarctica]
MSRDEGVALYDTPKTRVLDTDLAAAALGMAQPADIRRVIIANEAELASLGINRVKRD